MLTSASAEMMFSYLRKVHPETTFSNIKSDRINLGMWENRYPMIPRPTPAVVLQENAVVGTDDEELNDEIAV